MNADCFYSLYIFIRIYLEICRDVYMLHDALAVRASGARRPALHTYMDFSLYSLKIVSLTLFFGKKSW